ncbi:KEL2 [Candida margitis]|uniref:KEL2 n=1 Tax=Candida margitis TaxID=1775924 RepID=UPI0022261FD7|nr:KEL2 [Candida margitis]KAI5956098.1 KEL2 [Candida margitis]
MKRFRFGRKNSTANSTTSSTKNSPRKEKVRSSRTSKSSASFQAPNSPPRSPLQDKGYHTFGADDLNSNDHHSYSQQRHGSTATGGAMPSAQDHHSYTSEPFGITTDPSTVPYKSRAPPHLNVSNPWNRFKIFDSPFPRYRHAASAISSDKNEVFIMGGLKDGSVFGDTWRIIPHESHEGEVLNYSAENIEVSNNNNPPARVGHSSVLCGNAFIIYGGDTVETDENGFPDNNFYLFNINNHKYTIPSHIKNKPNGRYGHTIGVVAVGNSSRLYLFGGQLENDVFNDMYYFELNSFKSSKASWKVVDALNNFKPPPLTNHSMSVYKEKIYVFGGVYNNEKVSNDLWEFDAKEERWQQIQTSGTTPLPVNEHSACVVDDRLYIYGGNDFSGVIYSSLYVLDLKTFTWYKLLESAEENGPGPRCGHSMTYLPKFNKLIIMGGDKNDYIVADPQNFDTYEAFDGAEVGTMVYELDVSIVDQFISEPVERARKPRKAAASASAAAAASSTDGFDRHSRTTSAGPEDYATPRASPPPPDRSNLNRGLSTNTMSRHADFVDVETPSGTISQVDPEDEHHLNPYDAIDRETNEPQIGEPVNNGHLDKAHHHGVEDATTTTTDDDDDDDDDAEAVYLKRRSLDPKFNHENEDVVTNGVSGAGVAAAFAAAGAAGKSAGHASVLKRTLGEPEDDDDDTIDERSRNRRSSVADKSYGSTSHYPDITSDHETSSYSHGRSYVYDDEHNEEKDDVVEPITTNRNIRATTSSSSNDRRLNQIIEELRNELDQVKSSTNQQLQTATEKIDSLQQQNAQLQSSHKNDTDVYTRQLNDKDAMINELKSSLDPSAWDPEQPQTTTNLSELSRYKLERLELNNKLLYLGQENRKLHDQFTEFEPFMNNQIGELAKFQKVIKVQEEQIDKLSNQVKDQEGLHKEINDWRSRFDNLSLEFENYKAIHNDDEIEVGDDEADTSFTGGSVAGDNRSILSSARTRRDISTQLENLVNLWNIKQPSAREVSPSATPDNNPVVAKLQQQVDDLLRISKQNDEVSNNEISTLRQELQARIANLKNLEDNYRESLQSVNNTSKALKLNQEELNNQRNFVDKLIKENNELKMFKSAHFKKSGGSSTPVLDDAFADAHESVNDVEDDEGVISNAHFNMKIKDLEADLYIIKQERDQLKDNVTALQKQLYLAQNN